MRCSVLTIGTELTSGQILNRNAAWISAQLESLGLGVSLHLTVPDERSLILDALEIIRRQCDLLFITGGLGPTSDDFTRDVIADWMGKGLVFHEASWERIVARMGMLGIPVAPSNRQQCFFPEGAQVLSNSQGTADAFHAFFQSKQLWVLPGPPRELAAIWSEHIDTQLKGLVPNESRKTLYTWQVIGRSEAELGEAIEKAVAQLDRTAREGLVTGYRAQRPYVEVKVWAPATLSSQACQSLMSAIEMAIGPTHLVSRDGVDVAESVLGLLALIHGHTSFGLVLLDSASGGRLLERLRGVERARRAQGAPARCRIHEVLDEEQLAGAECQLRLMESHEASGVSHWSMSFMGGDLDAPLVRTALAPFRARECGDAREQGAIWERNTLWGVEWALVSLLQALKDTRIRKK